MRLLLVRHGESICGVDGVIGGPKGCTGLTDRGFAQARALRDRLRRDGDAVDVILSSTLPRAMQTADVIAESFEIDVERRDDLCEFKPGDADGTRWEDWDSFDVAAEPDRPMSSGGESLNAFRARVSSMISDLGGRYDGRTVLAACHGGIVYMSLRVLFGISFDKQIPADVDNTSITEWHLREGGGREGGGREGGGREGGWHLVRFNDVAHLRGTDLLVTT